MADKFGDMAFELTPDQLEGISGGSYTAEQAAQLSGYLRMAKNAGMTKEQVLAMVPGLFASLSAQYPDVTMQEVTDYINSHWDSL